EAQLKLIEDAKKRFVVNVRAHESMRELLEGPPGYTRISPCNDPRSIIDEIPKLELDVKTFVIAAASVVADAIWGFSSWQEFETQIRGEAQLILDWALAQIDQRDLALMDLSGIGDHIAREIAGWVRKAQREFPPPWMNQPYAGAVP